MRNMRKQWRRYSFVAAGILSYAMVGSAASHDISDWLKTPPSPAPWDILQLQFDAVANSGLSKEQQAHIMFIARRDTIWPSHSIRVCFSPPPAVSFDKQVQAKIIDLAPLWLQGTPAKLDFGPPGRPHRCDASDEHIEDLYDIRILTSPTLVTPDTFEALIGNQARVSRLDVAPYSVVLAFGGPNSNFWKTQADFYILHEVGHALGALHEHQRVSCDWDIDEILKRKIAGLSTAKEIQDNLKKFDEHSENIVGKDPLTTTWDRDSVMAYNFETWYFKDREKDPCFRSPVNALSARDQTGMRELYSDPASQVASLEGAVRGGRPLMALSPELQSHFTNKLLGRPQSGFFDQKVATMNYGQLTEYQRRTTDELSQEERNVLEQILTIRARYETIPALNARRASDHR
jgi:hypothetical protein